MQTPTDAPQHPRIAGQGEGAGVRRNVKHRRASWKRLPLVCRKGYREGYIDGFNSRPYRREYEVAQTRYQTTYEFGRLIGVFAYCAKEPCPLWLDYKACPPLFVRHWRMARNAGAFSTGAAP